jgi:Cu(I)-responsive transcriptional regulator
MNIGEAAEVTGLPAKTIRYYEDIGLVAADRKPNGYRDYGETELHSLHFVQRARSLGFSVADCRDLLSLYRDRDRSSADVKNLARARLAEIDGKISELQSLRATLSHLIDACAGDNRPDCPIIDDLAGR